jgi:prolyl-tRNA synthetase
MRQSKLLSKTRKEGPRDEVSKNANLLVRAGFIHKEMAGAYSYLPLGLRVLNNIMQVIRHEMESIGGQEISLTALQEKATWEPTNQWDDKEVDVWFKTQLKNGTELGLAVTHEAAITKLMSSYVSSYRDLPFYAYQFQTKFRNELRSKSGIMRCREFIMKDLYSFSKDEEEHNIFYEKVKKAYYNIFNTVGLGDITYLTFANGGMFSKFSHEFQTVTDAGEDIIYVDEDKRIAINKEVYNDETVVNLGLDKASMVEKKSSEVGNIFTLSTRFSDALQLHYLNESGEKKSVFMGSYGLGPGRIMGTIVECLSDEAGIIWPISIAPYKVHIIEIPSENIKVKKTSEEIYKMLDDIGIEVLYDDRDIRAGEKFNDSDLIGIPIRIIISEKVIDSGVFEVKERRNGEVSMLDMENLIPFINEYK